MSGQTEHLLVRAALMALAALGVVGCAAGKKQVATPRFTLEHPDFWRVKHTAARDGEATVVIIPQYGDAVIDDGSGAMQPKGANYEAVTADVEARVYAWGDPGLTDDPTQEVARLLGKDPELKLPQHMVIPDHPPECGIIPKKYTVFGVTQTPIDLLSRPGWRTVVVGGRGGGVLLGVVARVEFEQDVLRHCHNLSNLRVQLQNLLDGIKPQQSAGPPPPRPAAQAALAAPAPAPPPPEPAPAP